MDLTCPYCGGGLEHPEEQLYVCTECERRIVIGYEQRGEMFLRRTKTWRWAIAPWLAAAFALAALATGSEAVVGVGLIAVVLEWLAATIWVAVHARPHGARVVWLRGLLVFFVGGVLRLVVIGYVAWGIVQST